GSDTITATGAGNNVLVGDDGEATLVFGSVRTVETTDFPVGGNDQITTGSGGDLLIGGSGSDTLSAGAGNDVLVGDNALVSFYPGTRAGVALIDLSEGGDDRLIGGPDTNLLFGGAGNDTYVFQAGDFSDDTIVEAGSRSSSGSPDDPHDALDFSSFGAGIRIDLGSTGRQIVSGAPCSTGPSLVITLSSSDGLEDVVGSPYNDVIVGNSRDNTLNGGQGNDRIYGEDGNDLLAGGGGSDFLDGGCGTNLVYFAGALTGVQVDLGDGWRDGSATDGRGGTDVLDDIQGAIGTEFADTLIGSSRGNLFYGGAGADTIRALGGSDTIVWNEGDGNDTIDFGSGNHDTLIVNAGAEDDQLGVEPQGRGQVLVSGGATGGPVSWQLSVSGADTLEVNTADAAAVVSVGDLGRNALRCVQVHRGVAPDLPGLPDNPAHPRCDRDPGDVATFDPYLLIGVGTSDMRLSGGPDCAWWTGPRVGFWNDPWWACGA
ncbi:MAG TPA: calcium-binding protein, partial [Acidimicrobiales bacterium]|nr:calcium-binding protein [Acidimicrobiales bacterium]